MTFNGVINAVNKDGSTGGDKCSDAVTLNLTEQSGTSIAELTEWKALKVYPNPAFHVLKISSEGMTPGNYELCIYDLNGKAVWQGRHLSKAINYRLRYR